MGRASCYGDPIQQVQAAIGRALRDEGDPTQPLPDHLTALARVIEYGAMSKPDEYRANAQERARIAMKVGTSDPSSPKPLKAPGQANPASRGTGEGK
jgi:hypothetical protein